MGMVLCLHPGVVPHLQRQEGQGMFDQQPHQALGVEDKFIPGCVLVPGRNDTCEVATEPLPSPAHHTQGSRGQQHGALWEPEHPWGDTAGDHQHCVTEAH